MRHREFPLGMIAAAWHMDFRGEQMYAEEILETLGISVSALRRLARREDYQFTPKFWANFTRRKDREHAYTGRTR